MAKKKQEPFNPFAKDAAAAKKKRTSFPRTNEPQKGVPTRHSPAILGPAPSAIKDPTSKPAIPLSHQKPKATDEPVVVKEVEESQSKDEIIEEITIEDSPQIDTVTEQSDVDEIDSSNASGPEGPAVAVGKSRSRGLRQKQQEKEIVENNDSNEARVSELIAESKALAVDSGITIEGDKSKKSDPISRAAEAARSGLVENKSASQKAYEKRSKMIAKKRKTRSSSAPSKRVVKLNRRKYMEFKVDVREILEEENVDEEHRANLLGSTWAKGERQGIDAAIEFVEEKLEDEIISNKTAERIIKVLKGYRKVR